MRFGNRCPRRSNERLSCRYEEEGGEPVLYVYEVQVEDEYQRKGIAKLVMKMMELVAWRLNFYSVMLTVMQANLSAIALYTSLGYAKHATSPPPSQDGKTGYFILVKRVPSKRQ
jgi:ribosomal protein S18 acetylase RimI-like enzyme